MRPFGSQSPTLSEILYSFIIFYYQSYRYFISNQGTYTFHWSQNRYRCKKASTMNLQATLLLTARASFLDYILRPHTNILLHVIHIYSSYSRTTTQIQILTYASVNFRVGSEFVISCPSRNLSLKRLTKLNLNPSGCNHF